MIICLRSGSSRHFTVVLCSLLTSLTSTVTITCLVWGMFVRWDFLPGASMLRIRSMIFWTPIWPILMRTSFFLASFRFFSLDFLSRYVFNFADRNELHLLNLRLFIFLLANICLSGDLSWFSRYHIRDDLFLSLINIGLRIDRLAFFFCKNIFKLFDFGLEGHICSLQILNVLMLRLHAQNLKIKLGLRPTRHLFRFLLINLTFSVICLKFWGIFWNLIWILGWRGFFFRICWEIWEVWDGCQEWARKLLQFIPDSFQIGVALSIWRLKRLCFKTMLLPRIFLPFRVCLGFCGLFLIGTSSIFFGHLFEICELSFW